MPKQQRRYDTSIFFSGIYENGRNLSIPELTREQLEQLACAQMEFMTRVETSATRLLGMTSSFAKGRSLPTDNEEAAELIARAENHVDHTDHAGLEKVSNALAALTNLLAVESND